MDSAAVATTKLFKVVGVSLGFVHGTYAIASSSTNEADRATVLNAGYIQFRIVDKDILYLPLKAFPLIDPTVALASTANNATIASASAGGGPSIPMLKLAIPVTINPFENFLFNMNFDAAPALANTLDMYVFLHSYMRRPG
jgi:hypothetical protein